MRKLTIREIAARNKEAGGLWFSKATMRFFNSIVYPETVVLLPNSGGDHLFVSSECTDNRSSRRYTIRRYIHGTCYIDAVGEFMQYASKSAAIEAMTKLVKLHRMEEVQ